MTNTELNKESVKGMDDMMEWAEANPKPLEYSPAAQEACMRQGLEPFEYAERN